jgi:hypothetical protein
MVTRLLSTVLAAGFLFSVAGQVMAADTAPKTKPACEKVKTMKWDDATSKCVKK